MDKTQSENKAQTVSPQTQKNIDPALRGTILPEHFTTILDFQWSGG